MPRPTAAERGYGGRWQKVRRRFLRANPTCCLCGAEAQVPDHWPRSRRELVAAGVSNPDGFEHLRPLCIPCHNRETARNQPGGFARAGSRRRRPEPHPGLIANRKPGANQA